MRRFVIGLWGFLAGLNVSFAQGVFDANIFVNGEPNGRFVPGEAALIELEIVDANGERVKEFQMAHGKIMHFVMIRKDLSTFAHFHPYYDPTTGLFQAIVNLPTLNPDNQGATSAVGDAGDYFVFAEAKPANEADVQQFRWTVNAEGHVHYERLIADVKGAGGAYVKYYTAEGLEGKVGDPYRVNLRAVRVQGDAGGELVRFFLTLHELQGGQYKEVEKLEPWLHMGGHAILMGPDGDLAQDRLYGHFHSQLPEVGGSLSFSYFNRGRLDGKRFKIWLQFQYKGVIFTAPFVLEHSQLDR